MKTNPVCTHNAELFVVFAVASKNRNRTAIKICEIILRLPYAYIGYTISVSHLEIEKVVSHSFVLTLFGT